MNRNRNRVWVPPALPPLPPPQTPPPLIHHVIGAVGGMPAGSLADTDGQADAAAAEEGKSEEGNTTELPPKKTKVKDPNRIDFIDNLRYHGVHTIHTALVHHAHGHAHAHAHTHTHTHTHAPTLEPSL